MKILITGGAGYIGGHLATSFLKDGHDVAILDNKFASKPWTFTDLKKHPVQIYANVHNIDAVIRAMRGVNVVYHLADRSDRDDSYRHLMRLTQANVMGTATVLSMARRAGVVRVVFTSSFEVYGNMVPASETDPCLPITMFGNSKYSAEAIVNSMYNVGLEVTTLRLFSVWGGKFSNSVINKFVEGANTVHDDGLQTRDFVHISDVITALRMASRWEPGTYNIGTGEEATISGIWSILNGDKEPEYVRLRHAEVLRTCADMSLTKARTNWQPKILLSQLSREQIIELCKG